MLHKQQGRGIALVLASFLLLAAGAALQWMQINRKRYSVEPFPMEDTPAMSPPAPLEPDILQQPDNPDGDGPPAAFP